VTLRIAMWSGPRNISTAMMRAFENRADCAVSDEPFYAAYLAETGLDHPMRDAVLASQPTDWRTVAAAMAGDAPGGAPVWYQKRMPQHMLPGYSVKRGEVTLDDIGVVQQRVLFEREADRLGAPPPVIEGRDVLADTAGALGRLCTALGLAFDPAMLAWPAGRRDSDGVWAPAWYDAVEASTGFAPPRPEAGRDDLSDDLRRIADAARPHYERLAAFTL